MRRLRAARRLHRARFMGKILRAPARQDGPREGPREGPDEHASSAEEDAAHLVDSARDEAQRLLQAARAEAEALRMAAMEAGRQDGLDAAARVRAEVERERERALEQSKADLLQLALAVAGKVLERAVTEEQVAVEAATRALDRLTAKREVRVWAHPADAPALRAAAPRLRLCAGARCADKLEVREDPAVGRGGVLVETEAGTVDARTQSRLDVVARCLGDGR